MARILRDTDYEAVWVPPVASDSGASLGSTLYHHHQTLGNKRSLRADACLLRQGLSATPRSSARWIRRARIQAAWTKELLPQVARDLADQKIVGWFQGRFEMGPRALGNRSILSDARSNAR